MPRIAEGRKAPDFTLEDAEGRPVSLADFKGKNVVVYFYPKDDRVADAAKHPGQVLETVRRGAV